MILPRSLAPAAAMPAFAYQTPSGQGACHTGYARVSTLQGRPQGSEGCTCYHTVEQPGPEPKPSLSVTWIISRPRTHLQRPTTPSCSEVAVTGVPLVGRRHNGWMERTELFQRLDRVVYLLEESWSRDLYPLQVSIAEYDRLARPLDRYRGSELIQMWHVDHLLIGCRRLVDDDEEVISIKRALIELRWIADHLTADQLAEYRRHRGVGTDATAVNVVREDMTRQLGVPSGDPVGKRHVQPHLTAINGIANRLKALVNHGTAHRLDTVEPADVTRGEVLGLLAELHNTYARCSIVLRATDVYARPEEENLLAPVVRALELFDWEEYVEGQSDAMTKHWGSAAISWAQLDERARIEYRFD